MAAALSQLTLNATIGWLLSKAVTGFSNTVQYQDSLAFNNSSLTLTTWTEVSVQTYTIASAGTQVVDLRSFTDPIGNSVTGTKAMALVIAVTGAVGDRLNVAPNASNGLVWPFHDASSSVDIPGGGFLLFSEGASSTGTTIDGTHKQLLLTNNGSASLTVNLVALVSDV